MTTHKRKRKKAAESTASTLDLHVYLSGKPVLGIYTDGRVQLFDDPHVVLAALSRASTEVQASVIAEALESLLTRLKRGPAR